MVASINVYGRGATSNDHYVLLLGDSNSYKYKLNRDTDKLWL